MHLSTHACRHYIAPGFGTVVSITRLRLSMKLDLWTGEDDQQIIDRLEKQTSTRTDIDLLDCIEKIYVALLPSTRSNSLNNDNHDNNNQRQQNNTHSPVHSFIHSFCSFSGSFVHSLI